MQQTAVTASGATAVKADGRHGPGHYPHANCAGSCIPNAPLWEQWRDFYYGRTHSELVSEASGLRQDEDRLARSMMPDRLAMGMIGMRLALIEECLSSPGYR